MSDTLSFILSLSIIFTVIIGVARFKKIDKSYRPFIYYACVSLLTELLVKYFTAPKDMRSVIITMNIYALLEFLFLIWLFFNWGLFNKKIKILLAVCSIYILLWLILIINEGGLTNPNWYFFILYSFALIFLGVNMLNKVIVQERGSIFSNSKFLISMGVVIFFTFFIIFCSTKISLFNIKPSESFERNLASIKAYANLFVNLLYAIAALWVPKKKNFINPF
jgi:hypothetical protein